MFKKIKSIFSNVENKLDSTKKNVKSDVKKNMDLLDKAKIDNPEYGEALKAHEKNCKKVNINKLKKIENNKNIDLIPKEILFLSYVDKRQSDDYDYPRYWTSKYNLDIQKTLVELFQGNYIKFADSSYKINGLKVSELKNLLKTYDLKTNGRKDDLIKRLVKNMNSTELDKINDNDYFQVTEKGNELLDHNEHIIYFHKKSNLDISIDEANKMLESNPNMDYSKIALDILQKKKNKYRKINDYGLLRNNFYNISTVYRDINEYSNEFKSLIVVITRDLFDGLFQYKILEEIPTGLKMYSKKEIKEIQKNCMIAPAILKRLRKLLDELQIDYEQLKNDTWNIANNLPINISKSLFEERFNLLLDEIAKVD